MKLNIKNVGACLLLGGTLLTATSCNDLLDLDPVSQITPDSFYKTADQLGAYMINYYGELQNPFSGAMFHGGGYDDGIARSDGNTDIQVVGGGNTQLFVPDKWEVSGGKQLQGWYGTVRAFNYFLKTAEARNEAGEIEGDDKLILNYIGEGYFFRALTYYRMLALYGDLPIVTEVLEDNNEVIVENSKRAPRNEVVRFILSDLDKAIERLYDRDHFKGQRVNKQTAALLKSRVALFEATFEKYHKGSGRVPGDANWPGAKMAYNQGKTFNIEAEIDFFLDEAMKAATLAVGTTELTTNNGVLQPEIGQIEGWNPYFEMFSQPSLKDVPEDLLWKEYNFDLGVKHNAIYRSRIGAQSGYTRPFIESFLMKDGLPIYATGGQYQYKGDKTIDDVKTDRDLRLQLFVWGESTLVFSDPDAGEEQVGGTFDFPNLISLEAQTRMISGYQSRKFYAYDYSQGKSDEQQGTNACPAFRVAEGMLNYLEACYEKNGRLDATAESYWRKIRQRAGVSDDFEKTIAATDLNKESDFGVYSGTQQVDKTLYNIRRERMQELFSEGFRFADLIRWRSFDRLITTKWVPEGVNFWDEMYTHFKTDPNDKDDPRDLLIADGSANANMSMKEMSKYVRPYSISTLETNELLNGYTWREAYYLYPLGITDIRTGSADRDLNNSNLYQNLYWPIQAGGRAEK